MLKIVLKCSSGFDGTKNYMYQIIKRISKHICASLFFRKRPLFSNFRASKKRTCSHFRSFWLPLSRLHLWERSEGVKDYVKLHTHPHHTRMDAIALNLIPVLIQSVLLMPQSILNTWSSYMFVVRANKKALFSDERKIWIIRANRSGWSDAMKKQFPVWIGIHSDRRVTFLCHESFLRCVVYAFLGFVLTSRTIHCLNSCPQVFSRFHSSGIPPSGDMSH